MSDDDEGVIEWFPLDIGLEELQLSKELGDRDWAVVWNGKNDGHPLYARVQVRRRLSHLQEQSLVSPLLTKTEARTVMYFMRQAANAGADGAKHKIKRALGL